MIGTERLPAMSKQIQLRCVLPASCESGRTSLTGKTNTYRVSFNCWDVRDARGFPRVQGEGIDPKGSPNNHERSGVGMSDSE